VECVCLSGAMLAKAGPVLDVCLVGGSSSVARHGIPATTNKQTAGQEVRSESDRRL